MKPSSGRLRDPFLLHILLEGKRQGADKKTTGATASVRASALFTCFASAKFGLRALSQSLAREFGPKGVHVAHVIVDGIIDIPRMKGYVFEHEDAKISPDAVRLLLTPREEWKVD